MTQPSKQDLSEHEEETTPLEDVLKKLLEAKPRTRDEKGPQKPATKS